MIKRNWSKAAEGRLSQARRLFHVAAILATSRVPALAVDSVAVRLREQTGATWHDRTVRRDLLLLVELGIAEKGNGFAWRGRDNALTRVAIAGAVDAISVPERLHLLETFLAGLQPPRDMTSSQLAIASTAARMVAIFSTHDRSFRSATLTFTAGEGWQLCRSATTSTGGLG